MKRVLSLIAAALAGALATMVVFMTMVPALAQGPVDPKVTPVPIGGAYGAGQAARGGWMQQGVGRGGWTQQGAQVGGHGNQSSSLVSTAAAALGITQQELIAQLMANGGSIADALKAAGIDPQMVADQFVATRAERLNAAVAAGRITQAQADAQLAIAKSMTVARLMQPFTPLGPGGIHPDNAPVSPAQVGPRGGGNQYGRNGR
ncbi:hypothetical protein [uncultured Chloroflexus sp.]|uniref:hypothetical protein n=1 Tax=uncultured Chloroflexus sp. TaxID=214040 RepID=UPI002601EF91|nr:hypothetical protein [uncultured Chloroflexus sp.]